MVLQSQPRDNGAGGGTSTRNGEGRVRAGHEGGGGRIAHSMRSAVPSTIVAAFSFTCCLLGLPAAVVRSADVLVLYYTSIVYGSGTVVPESSSLDFVHDFL